MKLTTKTIEGLKPDPTKRREVSDDLLPQLRIVLQPSGARSWAVRYRHDGATRKLTLGPWPGVGLADARDLARGALARVAAGEDPAATKRERKRESEDRAKNTVTHHVADWLRRDQAENRSRDEVERLFNREVIPTLGHRQVETITRRELRDLIDAMAERAPTYARRLHAHLHRYFKWLVGRDIVEASPMADLPKPGREVSRDRVLSDAELRDVLEACDAVGGPFAAPIKLLALSGARRDEVARLVWDEVDANERCIRLTGERTKVGEARTVPLTDDAMAILESAQRVQGPKNSPGYVFTTNGRNPISGWSKAKARIDTHIAKMQRERGEKPMPAWRIHDIRRTFATGAQRLGFRLEHIEAALGHLSGSRAGIVSVYQRYSHEGEKRQIAEAWGRHVAGIMDDSARVGAQVIPLQR